MPFETFLLHIAIPITSDDGQNFAWTGSPFSSRCVNCLSAVKVRNQQSGGVESHVLSASSRYTEFLAHDVTAIGASDAPNFAAWTAFSTYTPACQAGLAGIKIDNTGSGKVEVHVLNANDGFRDFVVQAVTPLSLSDAPNFAWAMGRWEGSGAEDLFAVKVANAQSGYVEVHVLPYADRYGSFALEVPTAVTAADGPNFAWGVGRRASNGGPTGASDLIGVKLRNTDSDRVEVHVLTAESNYQSFALHAVTPIAAADAQNFKWAIWDYDGDAVADLIGIKVRNTDSGSVEAHVLSGS